MKKLYLVALLFCLSMVIQAQFLKITTTETDSFPVPSGTDTTFIFYFYSSYPWSIHFDYNTYDATNATLGVYATDWPLDTGLYELLWIDERAPFGTNDNPKTLSDSSWVVWGDTFPFQYMVIKETKGNVTTGQMTYYRKVRPRTLGF